MAPFKIDIPGAIGTIDTGELSFLTTVKAQILENISNPYFGVRELTQKTGFSNSQFSRRLKLITTYSPAKIIRHFRMEHAMVLLSETRLSIKEISEKTGFLEQANFCRAFKAHFQHSPTDHRLNSRKTQLSFEFYCGTPLQNKDLIYIQWLANERPWLQLVLKSILENMHNENFDTDQLSNLLSISKSQLNRKLNTLLKISAARFIKNLRLQYAAELLVGEGDSLSDIAYQTGFFDHPHFSRSFKEAFKCTPRAFKKSHDHQSINRFIHTFLQVNKTDKQMH